MMTSTVLSGSEMFETKFSLFYFIIFESYMQKDFKLQKNFASNFVPKFKTTLQNSAAQRKATNGGYVGNLARGRICSFQLN
jgi:hypothetical protein